MDHYATVQRQPIRELGGITVAATSALNPTLEVLRQVKRRCDESVLFVSAHLGQRLVSPLIKIIGLDFDWRSLG